MQEPDNQAAASDVNAAETPEERDTSEVSVVPYMRIIPELPPLPHPPPFQELPTLPNPLAIPELSPLPQLSLVPSLRAFVASTEDTEELPPMRVVWLTSETETTAECPQPPDQSMPHTPEEETFDILKWRLSAQLECLLCIEIMMPPIVFCKNGHMICSKCGPKLEKCPLCRDVITKQRNIFAEEVSKLLNVRCRYANMGCLVFKGPDKIQEHEDFCTFQTVECLAGYGAQKVSKCGWKGRKGQLLRHVSAHHGLTMIHSEQPILFTSPCVYEQDFMQVTLICAHSEFFWLTLKFDLKKNKRFEAVNFIGPATKAKEFRYKCDLVSCDGETGTSFFSITRSIFHETDDVSAASHHFQMDIDVFMKLFVEKDGYVPGYKLTIEKVSHSE